MVEAGLQLSMLQTFDSGEREKEDGGELIGTVSDGERKGRGLKVRNVVQLVGSSMAVLEVMKDDGGADAAGFGSADKSQGDGGIGGVVAHRGDPKTMVKGASTCGEALTNGVH